MDITTLSRTPFLRRLRNYASAIIILFSLVSFGQAQPADSSREHLFGLEVDPVPFALGGGAAHLTWTPKQSDHFTIGLNLIVNVTYPDFVVNMNSQNRDQGWSVKINQGIGHWVHYYIKARNRGWFVGLQMATMEMELTNDSYPGAKNRTNLIMFAVQAGYHWYPWSDNGIFLRPWAGLGYQTVIKGTFEPGKVTTDMRIGDKTFELDEFLPFVAIHIGYTF
jgi:hypothetical protein